MKTAIVWTWQSWSELSREDLYKILQARQEVFTVEQKICYTDADDKDEKAWHLCGWDTKSGKRELAAYLRAFPPGVKYKEAAFGRVLTRKAWRGQGIGKILVKEAHRRMDLLWKNPSGIRISAQAYLEKFYSELGYQRVGAEYLEEEIPHLEMLRLP